MLLVDRTDNEYRRCDERVRPDRELPRETSYQ